MPPEIHRRTNPQPPKLSIKFDVTIVIGSQDHFDETISADRQDQERFHQTWPSRSNCLAKKLVLVER